MSAKIETSQPVPCNQQQVMPAAAYDHQYQHAPPMANSESCHYAGAHRLGAPELKKATGGKESESNHAKYALDGFLKSSNIVTD